MKKYQFIITNIFLHIHTWHIYCVYERAPSLASYFHRLCARMYTMQSKLYKTLMSRNEWKRRVMVNSWRSNLARSGVSSYIRRYYQQILIATGSGSSWSVVGSYQFVFTGTPCYSTLSNASELVRLSLWPPRVSVEYADYLIRTYGAIINE